MSRKKAAQGSLSEPRWKDREQINLSATILSRIEAERKRGEKKNE